VQFGIIYPIEHVPEQKITTEKTWSTWQEAEPTGCIPTFRQKSDIKSTQTRARVTTSTVYSLLNVSMFVLHKCSYVFLWKNNAALPLDTCSDSFSLGRSRWKSDVVALLQNKQIKTCTWVYRRYDLLLRYVMAL
jgi:hypothetical protein